MHGVSYTPSHPHALLECYCDAVEETIVRSLVLHAHLQVLEKVQEIRYGDALDDHYNEQKYAAQLIEVLGDGLQHPHQQREGIDDVYEMEKHEHLIGGEG